MGIMVGVDPLVAFLPGFAQRGDAWDDVAERVGQKYRSIAIDFASWTFDGRLREIADRVDDGDVVVGQRRGRLSHDPERLAQLLRSAGQGMFEPVWHELERIDSPVLAIAGEL